MNIKYNRVDDPNVIRRLSDEIIGLFEEIYRFDVKSSGSTELDKILEKVENFARRIVIYQDFHLWCNEMTCMRNDDFSETTRKIGELLKSKHRRLLEAWRKIWRESEDFTFEESLKGVPAHPHLSSITFARILPEFTGVRSLS